MIRASAIGVLLFGGGAVSAFAEEAPAAKRVTSAVESGLGIVQKATKNYPEHRKCFSCHHQTLPMLAMTEARAAGFSIDESVLTAATTHTHDFFTGRRKPLRQGKRIGGSGLTVGYGLWALALGDAAIDDTSQAMVAYLIQTQNEDGRWRRPSFRPPMSESDIACTAIAAYYLPMLAHESQQDEVEASVAKARGWLEQAEAKSQEDRNLRLWGLHLLGADEKVVEEARQSVQASQREDGGFGQLDDMPSDAYATGQTLYVLRITGTPAESDVFRRGVSFLLDSQQEDGSWFVETRAKPVQTFFDNGDPHGKSQFISVAATGWAVAALAQTEKVAQAEEVVESDDKNE